MIFHKNIKIIQIIEKYKLASVVEHWLCN